MSYNFGTKSNLSHGILTLHFSFGMKLNQVYIDLCYLLRKSWLYQRSKGSEKKAGIDRGELDELDGYSAVLLWNDYQKSKHLKSLETLLAYNIQDVVNLEYLMALSYNLKLRETPFSRVINWNFPPIGKFHSRRPWKQ